MYVHFWMGICDLLGLRCDLEKYSKAKRSFFFFLKNGPIQEEKRRVSRISKYSKCLAEEEERRMLQAYRYHGTRWKEAECTHPPSAVCWSSPQHWTTLHPLISVSAAGVQHARSSNWASLTSQVRKFLLMPSHTHCCWQTIRSPTFCRWWATSVPSDILVSLEWLCWWRLRLRYLDVWCLRVAMLPITTLRATKTNRTWGHLTIMIYVFPACERWAFYPNLMRRRNAVLNRRMTCRIAQSNKMALRTQVPK